MIVAGCDLGSTTAKAVIMEDGEILSSAVITATAYPEISAEKVLGIALEKCRLTSRNEIKYLVTTGYGRQKVSFADDTTSEITAHTKGVHWLCPEVRTILDIGGQDCKAIHLNNNGKVIEFGMNDKCAAGTGRFLENMAKIFCVDVEAFSKMALESESPTEITSQCSVFAESEVITLINLGYKLNDIAAGLHNSVAGRLSTLLRRTGLEKELTMTGGGAKNAGLVKAVENKVGVEIVKLPLDTQICGALGAALLAVEKADSMNMKTYKNKI